MQLHPAQQTIWANRKKYNVWRCGRRFGKTQLALVGIIAAASHGATSLYCAPTYPALEQRFEEFERTLKPLIKPGRDFELNFKSGGTCKMFGLHNPDSIRGGHYFRAIMDEFAHAPYAKAAWEDVIAATLMDLDGDAYFISTPAGKNFFYELSQKCRTEPDWVEHHYTSYDNPFLKRSVIENKRRNLPELRFRQEYLAEFVSYEGTLVKEGMYHVADMPDIDWYMGIDLAYSMKKTNDFTAIGIVGRKNGKVYIPAVWRGRGSFEELLGRVSMLADEWKPRRIAVEEVGAQTWFIQELLKRTHLPVKGIKPIGDKVQRFYPLLAQYERGNVFHARDLPDYYKAELLNFTGTAQDDHDDMIDAVAYAYDIAPADRGLGIKI